jgi:putative polyhydroxyalkanoate system protein
MDLEIPHSLGAVAAQALVAKVTPGIARDFGAECSWDDASRLRVTRKGLQATLSILEDRVRVNVELGLFLRPMGPSIRNGIAKRLAEILA